MDEQTTIRNTFATRLYEKLAGTQVGQNLFLSPFSVQVALAMTAVGAKGETRRVMADLIGAPESVDAQNRQYARLLKSIYGEGERPFQLVTANALWGQKGYHFKPAFQEAIADFYDGAMHEVDFRVKPDEAVKAINAWVGAKTRERIKELIQRNLINKDTCLILTNAIYFKGQWEARFQKTATGHEDWHGPHGTVQAPMMHRRGDYLYYEASGFQALDMPYKSRQLSMLVVLPKKMDGLDSVDKKLADGDTYHQVTKGLRHEKTVILSLPRFKLETEFLLKPVLCGMDAEPAFSVGADFSGIADERLAISEVVHKAFVEVNEEGTEAAAATVGCAGRSDAAPQPKIFKADHPFLFFIWDRKTNTVFFSGRLVDPKWMRGSTVRSMTGWEIKT